jgi:hypothetical protein
MPTWKKVIVSGSQAHLQGITASNIPSAPNPNFLLYNSESGQFTYLSTSSIGNVQGTGTANQVTYWTGTNTVAGNYQFTFNPTTGPSGAARVYVSGEVLAGYLRADTKLISELDTDLSGSVKLGNNINNSVTVKSQTITLENPLLSTANVGNILVLTSSNRIATQSIDTRVFGTSLVDATNGVDNRIATFTDANSLNGESNLTFDGTTFAVSTGFTATTAGNVTIAGDLTVNGTTTTIDTSNLLVEDKFIILAHGSGSISPRAEGGIIVEGSTADKGQAFIFNSGSTANVTGRWGLAADVHMTSSDVTPTDFMVTVSSSAVSPSTAPTYGGSNGGYGNIYVNSSDESIWIFS